jgi:2-keto-4-pentenoate hydratase
MPPRNRRLTGAAAAVLLAAAPAVARAECPSDATMQALAQNILANRTTPALQGMTSLADGICAQDKLVALLSREWGRPVGYKVGLTAPPAQQMFGVNQPVWGVIYENTVRLRSGAEVPAAFGATPQVEADFLLRVKDDGINDAGRDHVEILRHLEAAIPYVELPDLVLSGKMDAPNLLAMNVGARLGVLGDPVPVQPTQAFADRLANMTVVFSDDTGKEIARAPGRVVLGHPLNVVAFLVEDLKKAGRRLQAGDLLSVAGYSAPVRTEAGRTYTVRYEGLADAPVSVSVRTR